MFMVFIFYNLCFGPQLVILHDDDVIEWDEEHPPLCEEERHRYSILALELYTLYVYVVDF